MNKTPKNEVDDFVEELLKTFNKSKVEERDEEPWMIISYSVYEFQKNKHLQELINTTKTLSILVEKDKKVYKVDENGELVSISQKGR